MNNDIKYIQENFIESSELCQLAEISNEKLEDLIEKELIPKASYKIEITSKISSPLGDEKMVSETKNYFPKNTTSLIERNIKLKDSAEFKKTLQADFIDTFITSTNKKFGYNNILMENGSVDMNKLNIEFEQEWQYYLQGIYGICTLNATGYEIAKKEIAVKELMDFNTKHEGEKLTDKDKQALRILDAKFNEISNLFAPYQREHSSRGKYLDKILKKNALTELIKKYD